MSHAKRVTRDNRKNPEYHVVVPIRKLRTDTKCPAGKPWPNHVKNEQHIGSEKTFWISTAHEQNAHFVTSSVVKSQMKFKISNPTSLSILYIEDFCKVSQFEITHF